MKLRFLNSLSFGRLAKADIINILLIIALWFFMVILVNPLGNFPMIDDWVYGLSVKYLLENGDFRLPSYASANVFSQVYWGALFCLPFGFSFTALRFSTLTLGLVGVLVTYVLLREVNTNSKISLIGAFLIAINPIYFGLSNTFMTDVPFFAFFVLSLYFLIRGLKRDSNTEIIIGIAISYIALLIRQLGLIIPLAFGVAYLVKKSPNLQNIIKVLIPILLGLSIQIFYHRWLNITGRIPPLQNPQYNWFFKNVGSVFVIKPILSHTLLAFIYMGWFIFPLLIIIFLKKFKGVSSQLNKKLIIFGLLTFWVSVIGQLIYQKRLMPLSCCHLDFGFGFGPLFHLRQPLDPLLGSLWFGQLRLLKSPGIPLTLKMFWVFITAIGVFGIALLLYYLWLVIAQIFTQNQAEKYLNTLVISAIFIYLFPLLTAAFMDRYLLPLLPLFIIAALITTKDINKLNVGRNIILLVLAVMLIYGGFTILSTHDYLSRDRTIWQALRTLMQEDQIPPNRINGGYEFNGWYSYDANYQRKSPDTPDAWWVDDADYVISSGPIKGYEEVKRYPFERWLILNQGNIFVLHKSVEANSVKP